MRAVAISALVAAAAVPGCANSLDLVVPGPVSIQERADTVRVVKPATPRLQLELSRESLSLHLMARLTTETTREVRAREIWTPLTWSVAWSAPADGAELVLAVAVTPLVMPLYLYQLVWWVYGRGLTPDERNVRGVPFGEGVRDAWFAALWPGVNAEGPWSWRASLAPLDAPVEEGWRTRTRTDAVPIAGAVLRLSVSGAARGLLGTTGPDGRVTLAFVAPPPEVEGVPLKLGGVDVPAEDLRVEAAVEGPGGAVATLVVPADYLARAWGVNVRRVRMASGGRTAELHRDLAWYHESAGAYLVARGEWRRIAAIGTPEQRREAVAGIAGDWANESVAARAGGDPRRAFAAEALARVDAALFGNTPGPLPSDPAELAILARALAGADPALRWPAAVRCALAPAPLPETLCGPLLVAGADRRDPVGAYAALRALARHPDPLVPEFVTPMLRLGPPEVRAAAAEALLAADAERGLRQLVAAADEPAIHWVLTDATGALLPPDVTAWEAWWRTDAGRLRWDAASRAFRTSAG